MVVYASSACFRWQCALAIAAPKGFGRSGSRPRTRGARLGRRIARGRTRPIRRALVRRRFRLLSAAVTRSGKAAKVRILVQTANCQILMQSHAVGSGRQVSGRPYCSDHSERPVLGHEHRNLGRKTVRARRRCRLGGQQAWGHMYGGNFCSPN